VKDSAASDPNIYAQLKQREHFDWFAENPSQNYTAYQQTPFWVAVDRSTYEAWLAEVTPGGWILDVGCADGRSAFPFADANVNVVGFDVSSKMVAKATHRAKEMGLHGRTTFFTGAVSATFPFRESSFDYVVIYGVLHHLPNPGRAYREAIRVLKPGGVYFGGENNRSAFRTIFNSMMKFKRLWIEEAGAQPLISASDLLAWNETQPAVLTYRSSVFLPPHFYNMVGHRLARPCLDLSDRFSRLVPWYGRQGGLIVFEAHKKAFP
jgi:ubiquinone/menaquinone biosynthesis C-methylase UbiE